MSAPISFGEWVIVPVNQGGAISIFALDPKQDGKTVWSSFLCDEPESGAEPCSPIHLSIEGSDLFVCTGMGVVFVLDPSTGMVRFAKRYKRKGREDDFSRRHGWTVNRLLYSGWTSDLVIPYGRQMICFASDSDMIFALDRNTGEMIWRTEMNPVGYQVDHVLGIHEDVLYAAGQETVIAYDLLGEGRMIWGADQMFDGKSATGAGVVTSQGLFIPVDKSIYHFSLSSAAAPGKLVKKIGVDLGTGAPVGNLYSYENTLWVHGGNRLYQVKNVEVE
jgi:outer membrane protein assembly factor BamB